jgi:hypothetical protein
MSESHSEITFYPEQRYVRIQRFGTMDTELMISGAHSIVTDPRFSEIESVLSDLTDARISLSSSDMTKYAKYCEEQIEGTNKKIAIIAPNANDFGMARMFEVLSRLQSVRVFYNQQEALDWLDIKM